MEKILGKFVSVDLAEMGKVKLMNRVDTKYVTVPENLCRLLERIREDYYVQEIGGRLICSYKTLYYDTPDFEMYTVHHNGRKARQKVRIRTYLHSEQHFLEVKNKNNKGLTRKKRIEIERADAVENTECRDFMEKHADFELSGLVPHLESRYDRITLVDKEKTERITIDLNLGYDNLLTGNKKEMPGLVIIEVKQDGYRGSGIKYALGECGIKPMRISKYCIGAALTNPSVKYNRFKEKIQLINKLTNYECGYLV